MNRDSVNLGWNPQLLAGISGMAGGLGIMPSRSEGAMESEPKPFDIEGMYSPEPPKVRRKKGYKTGGVVTQQKEWPNKSSMDELAAQSPKKDEPDATDQLLFKNSNSGTSGAKVDVSSEHPSQVISSAARLSSSALMKIGDYEQCLLCERVRVLEKENSDLLSKCSLLENKVSALEQALEYYLRVSPKPPLPGVKPNEPDTGQNLEAQQASHPSTLTTTERDPKDQQLPPSPTPGPIPPAPPTQKLPQEPLHQTHEKPTAKHTRSHTHKRAPKPISTSTTAAASPSPDLPLYLETLMTPPPPPPMSLPPLDLEALMTTPPPPPTVPPPPPPPPFPDGLLTPKGGFRFPVGELMEFYYSDTPPPAPPPDTITTKSQHDITISYVTQDTH